MERDPRKSWVAQKLEDPKFRLGVEQERLSDSFVDQLEAALAETGISRAQLAKKMERSRPYVTQALQRGRNLTLKTIVEMSSTLGYDVELSLQRRCAVGESAVRIPVQPTSWWCDVVEPPSRGRFSDPFVNFSFQLGSEVKCGVWDTDSRHSDSPPPQTPGAKDSNVWVN